MGAFSNHLLELAVLKSCLHDVGKLSGAVAGITQHLLLAGTETIPDALGHDEVGHGVDVPG